MPTVHYSRPNRAQIRKKNKPKPNPNSPKPNRNYKENPSLQQHSAPAAATVASMRCVEPCHVIVRPRTCNDMHTIKQAEMNGKYTDAPPAWPNTCKMHTKTSSERNSRIGVTDGIWGEFLFIYFYSVILAIKGPFGYCKKKD
ncbi:hypothetical protein V6Z11_D13G160500 [Gossypium hirsutum]